MYTPISNYKILLIPITFTTTALVNKHMLLEEQVIAVKLKKTQRCLIGKTTYSFFGEVGWGVILLCLFLSLLLTIDTLK